MADKDALDYYWADGEFRDCLIWCQHGLSKEERAQMLDEVARKPSGWLESPTIHEFYKARPVTIPMPEIDLAIASLRKYQHYFHDVEVVCPSCGVRIPIRIKVTDLGREGKVNRYTAYGFTVAFGFLFFCCGGLTLLDPAGPDVGKFLAVALGSGVLCAGLLWLSLRLRRKARESASTVLRGEIFEIGASFKEARDIALHRFSEVPGART